MAPAYHCVTMLDPAIALGGDVLLYPLKPDLSPDLESLDSVFAAAGSPVRALLATHFFGLAQDFAQQHLADQRLPEREREGYTLLLAMRSWEFEAFAQMRRTARP